MKKVFLILNENKSLNSVLLDEFNNQKEIFESEIILSISNDFWHSVLETIQKHIDMDYLIFSNYDHLFSQNFTAHHLEYCISKAQQLNGDILIGSTETLDKVLEIDEHLFWIDHFKNPKLVIIFKSFYNTIVNNSFGILQDHTIQQLTENIFLTYPFLSRTDEKENIENNLHLLKEIKKFYSYE